MAVPRRHHRRHRRRSHCFPDRQRAVARHVEVDEELIEGHRCGVSGSVGRLRLVHGPTHMPAPTAVRVSVDVPLRLLRRHGRRAARAQYHGRARACRPHRQGCLHHW